MEQKVVSITMEPAGILANVDPAPRPKQGTLVVTFNVSRVDSFELEGDVLTLKRSSITAMGAEGTGLCIITWTEIYTRVMIVRVEANE